MSARNALYTNPNLCKHLVDYKQIHGLSGYNSLQKHLKITPSGKSSVNKHQSEIPRCGFCDGFSGRLYLCLVCSSVSCSNHTLLHTRSENGHDIAVDIERSELYCVLCRDQLYDPDFDKTVMVKQMMDSPNGVVVDCYEDGGVTRRTSKRKRLGSGLELDLKKSKELALMRDRRAKSCYPLGLRGLNNLGSTCFMNSVLQALLHAPPFRNYFLSHQHNHEVCRKRSSSDRLCLPCDIDVIFSSMFSGDRTPYSPAQFLYSWWQHSVNLASYEQQDAHEFFISVLDGIHEKEGKTRNLIKDNGDCQCIAHRAFSGLLRSDVTCLSCGFTSTTYDPCMDISLNLDCSSIDSANKSGKPHGNTGVSTLLGCLDLFTKPEKLGSDQKFFCENCQERQDSLKQMSMKRLPLVLCLHIKRFEHSLLRKMSRKIDSYLQFPFSLDMNPYLSSSIIRNRFGNRIFAFEGDEADSCSAEFEIFAAVTHSGMLDSGHYVTYLRLENQWYRCDDAWISEVDEGIVRASQSYMLFYVQKMFSCKANEELSCQSFS